MSRLYIEGQEFEKTDFSAKPLERGDYENCSFVNCNFSGTDLSHVNFSTCSFVSCIIQNTKMVQCGWREVQFRECKLLGLGFEHSNPFLLQFDFRDCILDLSSFYRLQLKKTRFVNCSLQEVDFSNCDLSSAVFDHCNLSRARFEQSILEKADLRTAFNFSIDPALNRMKKAKFSAAGLVGLLDKYDLEID